MFLLILGSSLMYSFFMVVSALVRYWFQVHSFISFILKVVICPYKVLVPGTQLFQFLLMFALVWYWFQVHKFISFIVHVDVGFCTGTYIALLVSVYMLMFALVWYWFKVHRFISFFVHVDVDSCTGTQLYQFLCTCGCRLQYRYIALLVSAGMLIFLCTVLVPGTQIYQFLCTCELRLLYRYIALLVFVYLLMFALLWYWFKVHCLISFFVMSSNFSNNKEYVRFTTAPFSLDLYLINNVKDIIVFPI